LLRPFYAKLTIGKINGNILLLACILELLLALSPRMHIYDLLLLPTAAGNHRFPHVDMTCKSSKKNPSVCETSLPPDIDFATAKLLQK